MTKANNQRDIQLFVTSFNVAWINGKINLLNSLLHKKVVFLAPDLKIEFSGRKACLKTIEDYNKMAITETFDVTNINIKFWNNVAVVNLDYHVVYILNNLSSINNLLINRC